MSTYTGVTKFYKQSVFWPTLYLRVCQQILTLYSHKPFCSVRQLWTVD